ncbi:hypothetical protein RclHR1_18050001 [Rhizophagus clarus]|uniref:Uncharacterized protein n=1 Tax=Rhizophagus clarus TaxID=94130 RepID=A0A2Z6REH7_9GLOM|nr:hypothetical protein RclHR1_18050001 [Rhizophagus clarus]
MDNSYAKYVAIQHIFKGRMLALTLFFKGKIRFTIIVIYNYINNMMKKKITELYAHVKDLIKEEIKHKAKIIIMGDFNASYDEYQQEIKISTDYSVVTAYFSYDDIFRIKAIVIAKRHNTPKLPYKKDNPFLEQLPETIVYFKKMTYQLSKILLQLTQKKLPAYANDFKRYDYINSKLVIITDLSYRLNIDKPNILALSISEFKQFDKDLFNIVTIRFKKEDKDYKTERIKFFVDKRCQELAVHKQRVINSVLNCQRKCITLDKILINNNSQMELCLDPDVIDKKVTNHFQNAADWIDPRWYANLMQEITIEEWRKVIMDLSKEKASGLSKISNELLQYMGPNMFKFTLRLVNLCLTTGDIPTECPITLLETMRKAVVKIVTQKLSQIIANNNILKGGNHAALPGGFTEVPIRIMNLIMEDAKGKLISPLLWTIYYNPLLCEINKLQLGYTVTQSIVKNIQFTDLDKKNVMIFSQAYMDDVSWITDTSYKLESILQITDEFNRLNNIQINPDKFTLMTNDTNALKDKSIKLNFGFHVQEIQLIRLTELVRILGAWMNLNLSKVYVFNQYKNIIAGYNKIIRNKQLTDKMIRYIYNAVIISSIEYKSQHTILNDKQVAALNILVHTLFKKKTNLVMTILNCMIHSSLGYVIKNILTIQLQRQVTRLHNQLQNKGLLDMLSQLSIIRLQQETLFVNNVLTGWSIHLKDLKIKFNLIARSQLPITQILNSDLLFKDRLNYHLQRHNIYFLSQIMAADRLRLLTYSDLQIRLGISIKGHKPNWYKRIEQHCIINIALLRKVKSEFTINRQYHLQGNKNLEEKAMEHWIHNINDDSISLSIQAPVLIKYTGCELKDIQPRSKRKTANNRCILFIDKEKTINVKAQSIQDAYILDSSVFEYIAMIENRIKYSTTNAQEASVRSMLDFFHFTLLRNQLINIQDTVKGQLSLTIYTDRSFKNHSDTSVMTGSAFKIIETNSIFQCQIQENPSVIKPELMTIIMALLCLDKDTRVTICTDSQIIINQFFKINTLSILTVQRLKLQYMKAYDSDDHSNVVDKLAKKACSKEYLVIDPKLLAHNGTICWNHKPIERNIILMVKDIKETQYIEQFLTLNKVDIDHNDIFTNINNLDCWNSSNIGILCLVKGIIPKSFSEFLKELKIPEQSIYKIMREVIDTLVLQFKYLIWEHHNVHQVKLEQSHGIDS